MPIVDNTLVVAATPKAVWALLMDVARYAEWNSRLVRVDGAFAPGAVVTLHYRQPRPWLPGRFVVDVDACVPEEELRWSGPRNLGRKLLRASHFFRLRPEGAGTCIQHAESFEGPLAGALWPIIGGALAERCRI
jgi:hypothetical protein